MRIPNPTAVTWKEDQQQHPGEIEEEVAEQEEDDTCQLEEDVNDKKEEVDILSTTVKSRAKAWEERCCDERGGGIRAEELRRSMVFLRVSEAKAVGVRRIAPVAVVSQRKQMEGGAVERKRVPGGSGGGNSYSNRSRNNNNNNNNSGPSRVAAADKWASWVPVGNEASRKSKSKTKRRRKDMMDMDGREKKRDDKMTSPRKSRRRKQGTTAIKASLEEDSETSSSCMVSEKGEKQLAPSHEADSRKEGVEIPSEPNGQGGGGPLAEVESSSPHLPPNKESFTEDEEGAAGKKGRDAGGRDGDEGKEGVEEKIAEREEEDATAKSPAESGSEKEGDSADSAPGEEELGIKATVLEVPPIAEAEKISPEQVDTEPKENGGFEASIQSNVSIEENTMEEEIAEDQEVLKSKELPANFDREEELEKYVARILQSLLDGKKVPGEKRVEEKVAENPLENEWGIGGEDGNRSPSGSATSSKAETEEEDSVQDLEAEARGTDDEIMRIMAWSEIQEEEEEDEKGREETPTFANKNEAVLKEAGVDEGGELKVVEKEEGGEQKLHEEGDHNHNDDDEKQHSVPDETALTTDDNDDKERKNIEMGEEQMEYEGNVKPEEGDDEDEEQEKNGAEEEEREEEEEEEEGKTVLEKMFPEVEEVRRVEAGADVEPLLNDEDLAVMSEEAKSRAIPSALWSKVRYSLSWAARKVAGSFKGPQGETEYASRGEEDEQDKFDVEQEEMVPEVDDGTGETPSVEKSQESPQIRRDSEDDFLLSRLLPAASAAGTAAAAAALAALAWEVQSRMEEEGELQGGCC